MTDTINKINNYLQVGGMFNPELIEHHKVSDLLLECRNELERLIEKCDKQAMMLRRVFVEHSPDTYFISGELGEKDSNGLPERIEICPAYGVDWTQIYQRTDTVIPGMGS